MVQGAFRVHVSRLLFELDAPYTSLRMIQAIQIVVAPFHTWEKITASRHGFFRVLLLYLLPFLFLGIALETLSLVHWGEKRGAFDYWAKVPEQTALRYAATQGVLLMCCIVMGAKFLHWIALSFQVRVSYSQCFTLMAYGFSPIILARYLDAIPGLNTWVAWALGALLALSVLYHGVALALKPEQTKGFGLYLVSVMVVLLSSALSHFAAVSVLRGTLL